MDDEYICPLAWKWGEIYHDLHVAWLEKLKVLEAESPASEPAGGAFDLDGDDDEDGGGDSVHPHAIPEPPHLLAPNSTDDARHHRWLETVAWAEEHGFGDRIPAIAEHEKYYRN
jgi:hypothetical protein